MWVGSSRSRIEVFRCCFSIVMDFEDIHLEYPKDYSRLDNVPGVWRSNKNCGNYKHITLVIKYILHKFSA